MKQTITEPGLPNILDDPRAIASLFFAAISLVLFAGFLTLSIMAVGHWSWWIPGLLGSIGVFGASAIWARNLSDENTKAILNWLGR